MTLISQFDVYHKQTHDFFHLRNVEFHIDNIEIPKTWLFLGVVSIDMPYGLLVPIVTSLPLKEHIMK